MLLVPTSWMHKGCAQTCTCGKSTVCHPIYNAFRICLCCDQSVRSLREQLRFIVLKPYRHTLIRILFFETMQSSFFTCANQLDDLYAFCVKKQKTLSFPHRLHCSVTNAAESLVYMEHCDYAFASGRLQGIHRNSLTGYERYGR